MRFLDALLGRTRPVKARPDAIFALATAQITLEARFDLHPSGRAGICFKPASSSYFTEMERDLRQILTLSGKETGTEIDTSQDSYGYRWVVMRDDSFDDLVSTVYLVSQELQAHGFGEQLLAAAFPFDQEGQRVYWIYNYKRGHFHPFAPSGAGKQRNNGLELRLQAIAGRELPVEKQQDQWFALWELPF